MKKRLSFILIAICFAISTWAVNLTGRTFSGKSNFNGIPCTVTYTFNAGGKLKIGMSTSQGSASQYGYWEMDGDYVHVLFEGQEDYQKVVERNGSVSIVIYDSYTQEPLMTLTEKKGGTGKKSGTKRKK